MLGICGSSVGQLPTLHRTGESWGSSCLRGLGLSCLRMSILGEKMAFGTFVKFCHLHQDPEALGKRVPHPYLGDTERIHPNGQGSQ